MKRMDKFPGISIDLPDASHTSLARRANRDLSPKYYFLQYSEFSRMNRANNRFRHDHVSAFPGLCLLFPQHLTIYLEELC